MKIGIASDHRGVYLKSVLIEYLEHNGYEVVDYGTDTTEVVDFPDYALRLGNGIKKRKVKLGIAIGGAGIGMSIALNKVKGVTCAKINNISEAVLCRSHDDVNAIAIGADVDEEQAKSMVDKFILTPFSNLEECVVRNEKIRKIEDNG